MTTTKYRHTFTGAFTYKEKTEIMEYIKSSILSEVKADIYTSRDDLYFTIPFWINRTNMFASSDKGKIGFENDNVLIYKISHLKSFLILLILAITFAIFTQKILIIVCMFSIIVLLNWLITKLRHRIFFKGLVSYANSVIENKTAA